MKELTDKEVYEERERRRKAEDKEKSYGKETFTITLHHEEITILYDAMKQTISDEELFETGEDRAWKLLIFEKLKNIVNSKDWGTPYGEGVSEDLEDIFTSELKS